MNKKAILEVLAGAITAIILVAFIWLLSALPTKAFYAPSTVGAVNFSYVDSTDYTFKIICPVPVQFDSIALYFTRSGIYDDKNVNLFLDGVLYDTEYIPIGTGVTATGKENIFATSTYPSLLCTGEMDARLTASSTFRMSAGTITRSELVFPLYTSPHFALSDGTGFVFGWMQYMALASSTSSGSSGSSPITVISQGGSIPMTLETNCTITSTSSQCVNTYDEFGESVFIGFSFLLVVAFTIWLVLHFRPTFRKRYNLE